MSNMLDRTLDFVCKFMSRDHNIERMEKAAVSAATASRKVADRLDEISRNRDPLAELVRNVKSANFRHRH